MDWIGRRFRALGHDIDTADAQYLIFLCGDLMHGLIGEIEKIGAYAQGRRVTYRTLTPWPSPSSTRWSFR